MFPEKTTKYSRNLFSFPRSGIRHRKGGRFLELVQGAQAQLLIIMKMLIIK